MKHLIRAKRLALVMTFVMLAQAVAPLALLARSGNVIQKTVTVPDGTEISVITTEEISSKTATEGDPLTFKVEEDVIVDGNVVVARGALVKGTVADAKKSGRMGKAGTLNVRIESTMTVDNQKIKLRATKGREGDDKTGTTVALVVLFGPLGFLKKGKDAKIKEGTRIKAYIDEEKKVAPKKE
ncbi:MAG TPA: hypothetical protein VM943_01445 [Pyrinomonadaceae bacterium]|nr:hypothetical protein [Pyrinomonadaceae bacterium]